MIGAILMALVVVVAVIAPLTVGNEASRIDIAIAGQGPSAQHLLGTDTLGQDILLRVLVATRLSLLLALASSAFSLLLGLVVGCLPAFFGKAVGRLVDLAIGVSIAFPGLLMTLFLAVVFGVSTTGAVLAIGIAGVPYSARLVRNLVRSVESREYIAAARLAGVGRVRIVVRHVLPNVAEPLILNAANITAGAVLAFAGLSFLGIGVQAPEYDWGALLSQGQSVLYSNPLAVVGPGLAVVIAGMAFNLLGDAAARRVADGKSAPGAAGRRSLPHAAGAVNEARTADQAAAPVLEVDDLEVTYHAGGRRIHAVRGVSLTIARRESVGVVGESGSGKSAIAMAVAQLIERPGRVDAGRLDLNGVDVRTPGRARARLLASELGVVFQDPMSSLNPVRRLGSQLTDGARYHERIRRAPAIRLLTERLTAVGIKDAGERVRDYPHEFSGGMRQRAMVAMALMRSPSLIIADEPTTALDVSTERRVLELLQEVCDQHDAALLLISHDMTVVKRACERVLVLYAGRVVEDLPTELLSTEAAHPYTRALLSAVPGIETDRSRPLTVIPGRVPDAGEGMVGCAFAGRCSAVTDRCRTEDPSLAAVGDRHQVACWNPQLSEVAGSATSTTGVKDHG
jgi:oligopeptide/dipeptide ABC transporter ATP-binding protein